MGPKNTATVPTGSCLARQAWLKKTTARRPLSSATSSSTRTGDRRRPRPYPGVGRLTRVTRPSTDAFSPAARSGDRDEPGAVDVAVLAWIVGDQVEDGLDAELTEVSLGRGAHPL